MRPQKTSPFSWAALSLLLTLLAAVSSWGEKINLDGFEFENVGGVYQIRNEEDLNKLAGLVNTGKSSRYQFKQTADITITGDYTPIGYGHNFYGTYDGDNHIIRGLKIYCPLTTDVDHYCGLFGYNAGTVKNVHVQKASITEGSANVFSYTIHSYMGGIAGYNFGTIQNSWVDTISITTNNTTGSITNASYSSYAGGIAGANSGTIDSCTVTKASISGGILYNRGGITGGNGSTGSSKITNCVVTSSYITGTGNVGGIIGLYSRSSATIKNNLVIGTTVSATNNTSGTFYGSMCENCTENSGNNYYYYNSSNKNINKLRLINSSTGACKVTFSTPTGFTFKNEGYYTDNTTVTFNFTTYNGYACIFNLNSGEPAIYYSDNTATVKMTRDTTATASDSLLRYNIVYNLFGRGTIPSNAPKTYTLFSTITLPTPTPSEEGDLFVGWYDNPDFNTDKITSIPGGSTGDKTFYALWKKDVATTPSISISDIPDQVYTKDKIMPTITIMDTTADITDYFTITYSNNINVGEATVSIKARTSIDGVPNYYGGSVTKKFNIVKATPTVTPPSATNPIYNGYSQSLVRGGKTSSGILKFSLDDIDYSTSTPSAKDVGTYTVYYKVDKSDNYNAVYGSIEATIQKATPRVTAPTANELTYNRSAQELITAGSTDFGTLLYKVCTKPTSCSNASEQIPTAVNAGTYTVQYIVEASDNYNSFQGELEVTIAKASALVPSGGRPVAKNLTYNGTSQKLVSAGWTNNNSICSVIYSLDGEIYNKAIPTAINAGDYTVYAIPDSNCTNTGNPQLVAVTIAKASPEGTTPPVANTLLYNGQPQELITTDPNDICALYSLDGENYSRDIPTAENAGRYTVYYKNDVENCTGDANTTELLAYIDPADPTVTMPTQKELVYNGKPQELVTAGSTNSAPMLYSLDGKNYSTDIPTAVNSNKYLIYIAVPPTRNYKEFNSQVVGIIEKAWPAEGKLIVNDLVYNGEPQELVKMEKSDVCVLFNLNGQEPSNEIPTAVDAGVYLVGYMIDEKNCVGNKKDEFKVVIERRKVDAPKGNMLTYTGKPQELITTESPNVCMVFSLDGKNPTFSKEIPTATEPGEYPILYRVDNTKNCAEADGLVYAKIGKDVYITPPQAIALVLEFTGEKQKLIIPGSTPVGTMVYSLNGKDYFTETPEAADPGFYTVHYKVDDPQNIYVSEGAIKVAIGEKARNYGAINVCGIKGKTYAIIDGDYTKDKPLMVPELIPVDSAIFSRKFSITTGSNYSTVMLPFDVKIDQLSGIDKIFEFVGVSRNKETNALQVEIAQVDKAMYAYKPYIVQMNKASLRIIGKVGLVASPSKSIYGQDEWLFIGVHTYTQWNEKSPDIGRVYGFSATPFKTQKNEYDAGQFVKFASGSFIKPLRAYLYYDGKPTNYSAGFYGRAASTASINEDLPETMDVVIVERESEEEHTTVIGKFNTRTGEFKMLRNYDLKGRKVNNTNKAHKAYYGKKVLKK